MRTAVIAIPVLLVVGLVANTVATDAWRDQAERQKALVTQAETDLHIAQLRGEMHASLPLVVARAGAVPHPCEDWYSSRLVEQGVLTKACYKAFPNPREN